MPRDFIHHDIAVEVPAEGALYQAMTDALLAADPGARVVPYTMFGGTDAKAFSELGIRCYGLRTVATARGSRLFRHVPRYRRTRPG